MRRKIALLLSLVISAAFFPAVSFASDTAIASVSDLQTFRDNVNSGNTYEGQTVTLTSQLDLSGINWDSIGTEEHPFKGTFNGGNYKITGLTASDSDIYMGLFGYTSGTIMNLTVETSSDGILQDYTTGMTESHHTFAGVIAAYNTGNITDCSTAGAVTGKNNYSYLSIGGICGMNKGTVSGCTNTARVYADNASNWQKLYADAYAGGICGINEGIVTNSSSDAVGVRNANAPYIEDIPAVYASSRFASAAAGGAVGDNRGTVSAVTSSGTVQSKILFAVGSMSYAYAGGICGSNTGTVSNSNSECYVLSAHHADSDTRRKNYLYAGGISGYNKGEMSSCSFTGLVTAGSDVDTAILAYAGGVCGYNYGKISGCEFASGAKITDVRIVAIHRWGKRYSPDYAGGICGYNNGGLITQCVAEGAIYPPEHFISSYKKYYGGITGANDSGVISVSSSSSPLILDGDSDIIQSYGLTPDKTASDAASVANVYGGGLTGINSGKIENCYYYNTSTNSIKTYNAGGLAGMNNGTLENCYSRANVKVELAVNADGIAAENNGLASSCYFCINTIAETVSGTKKTIAEMRKQDTFKNWPFGVCWQIKLNVQAGCPHFVSALGSHTFSGGNGTDASPYIIKTENDLYNIRFAKDASFRIVNDITYNGKWSPVGITADPFTGVIDGNHNTVTFASMDENSGNSGFIGYGAGCTVKNINLSLAQPLKAVGNTYKELTYVGLAVAQGADVNIENCSFDGNITVSAPFIYAGAIAGDVTGNITGCRSFGTISTAANDGMQVNNFAIGGIAGRIGGTMAACESGMSVTAQNHTPVTASGTDASVSEVGGLAGIVQGSIENCCYNGQIINSSESAAAYTGSAVGLIDGSAQTSYADADITSNGQNDGGFAAKLYNGSYDEAYFNHDKVIDNMVGQPATSSDFTSEGLLEGFRANDNGKYPWTVNTDDRMTLLHIKPVWLMYNGFTKCGFETNSSEYSIYYTTDGSNPVGSGTLYTEPFFCEDTTSLKYYAAKDASKTDIFNYTQAHKHFYPLQFMEMPKNQNGVSITSGNISDTNAVTVRVFSDLTQDVKMYIVFLDEYGVMKFAGCKDVTLTNGENTVPFSNISASGASAVQIFVWNDTIVPYTPAVKF